MVAIIVSGFPGVGKSVSSKNGERFLDSDSINFSWMKDKDENFVLDDNHNKIRNPDFPQNYIEHIKDNLKKADIIFVSSHESVRQALVDAGLPFVLVYPSRDLKDEYLKRYEGRGSPATFTKMMSNRWDDFLDQLGNQAGCRHLVLQKGEYLGNMLHCVRNLAKGYSAQMKRHI